MWGLEYMFLLVGKIMLDVEKPWGEVLFPEKNGQIIWGWGKQFLEEKKTYTLLALDWPHL